MSDDLEDIKSMMDQATPRPDPARRAENLALARKNFNDLQGSRQAARPSPIKRPNGLWTGALNMLNSFTAKAALTTSTALVACGVLFFTPQGQDLLRSPQVPEALSPATVTETAPIAIAEAEPAEASPEVVGDAVVEMEIIPLVDLEIAEQVPAEIGTFLDAMRPEARLENIPADTDRNRVSGERSQATAVLPSISANDAEPALVPMSQSNNRTDGKPAPDDAATGGISWDDVQFHNYDGGASPTVSPEAPKNSTAVLGNSDPDAEISELVSSLIGTHREATAAEPTTSESFSNQAPAALKITSEEPVSTFSIDVDTASYSVVRSSLTRGQLPSPEQVRIEEMINYFPYDYPAPEAGGAPFRSTISTFQTPWNADTQLVHVALQGRLPAIEDRPPLNLVFLIDTSGSMNDPAKLPLLKQSFRLMLGQLRPEDEVAIVEYAGSAGQVLAPTPASERATIQAAIDGLGAGGSTNGQGGLEQAYAVAAGMAEEGEVNRVILATDGDFNVGLSDPSKLEDFIAGKRESGTYLSVLGFGRGNLDDATMQALAQNGNGTAAYIDTLSEAQKVLVDQMSGALFPIAGDVKVQVEFNPAQVAEYRLIGYETRALRREDFNNDAVDAGELGAGHSVTAIYEITPVGSPAQLSDPLRYSAEAVAETSDEIGYVKLRYKDPGDDVSQLLETPIFAGEAPGAEAQFAAAIAGFGQLLRDPSYMGDWGYAEAIDLASASRGTDLFGYRSEAVQLMRLAQSLSQ